MDADALSSLGWNERAARAVAEVMAPGCTAGRVVRVDLDSVVVAMEAGDRRVRAREAPAVGDWVVAHVQDDDAVVVGVRSPMVRACPPRAPRLGAVSGLSRRTPRPGARHGTSRQIVGRSRGARGSAGMGQWRATRRTAHQVRSGLRGTRRQLGSRLAGVQVVPVSTVTGVGAADVAEMLRPALAVLFGPSGAGKSSLANVLLGREAAPTGQVRPGDHRGRHVTSNRGLYAVPTGGVIIRYPRATQSGPHHRPRRGGPAAFPDHETLATDCRFGDCRHEHEPDCVVLAAERDGKATGVAWRTIGKLPARASSSNCGVTIRPRPGRTGESGRRGARRLDGSSVTAGTSSPRSEA